MGSSRERISLNGSRKSPNASQKRSGRTIDFIATLKGWLPVPNIDANFVFAIAIRLAGGPKPASREIAVDFAKKKGTVRTKELTDIGVHRCYLARMCEEGLLEKVGYGLYRVGRKAA